MHPTTAPINPPEKTLENNIMRSGSGGRGEGGGGCRIGGYR